MTFDIKNMVDCKPIHHNENTRSIKFNMNPGQYTCCRGEVDTYFPLSINDFVMLTQS